MAITYDAPSNTITVTGYSESVPCTFEDVYQADQAGGWGVVSKQGVVQYLFDCKLIIGDGSTETWFEDFNKQITFGAGCASSNGGRIFWVKANAYLTLGKLVNATNKSTSDGVSLGIVDTGYQFHILMQIDANARAYLYNAQLSNYNESVRIYVMIRATSGNESRLWNSQFNNLETNWLNNVDIYNFVSADANVQATASTAFAIRGTNITADDVKVYNAETVFGTAANAGLLARNVYARENTYIARAFKTVTDESYRPQLINVESDTWNIFWVDNALSVTNMIYRQYTFNLKVTEQDGTAINGATVTLKDKDDNQVFSVSTAADGTITEQTVTRGYYDQAHGDTLQDYSPHKLIIEKAGFQTYEIQGITMEKIDWTIKLAKAIGVFLSFGSPVINLKKTDPENKNVIVL